MQTINPKHPLIEIAIFAGGCFWCVEKIFEDCPGVISVISGYTGGHTLCPTYEQVHKEKTEHKEAVQVTFNSAKISYAQLLNTFWLNIDPFNPNGQFCDKGDSYRAVIFYTNKAQKQMAEVSKKNLEVRFSKPIDVEISEASTFYPAEEYHQKYAKKNPIRYKLYRYYSKRDKKLQEIWKNKKMLTIK